MTVQAIDGGIPPLSNIATVNVTVTDCNDNAPMFSQPAYNARIREDAHLGDKILQVSVFKLNLFPDIPFLKSNVFVFVVIV